MLEELIRRYPSREQLQELNSRRLGGIMTVYTIFAAGGRELGKFTSLEEAAIAMLTQDGHRFQIRQVKDRYRLFVSP